MRTRKDAVELIFNFYYTSSGVFLVRTIQTSFPARDSRVEICQSKKAPVFDGLPAEFMRDVFQGHIRDIIH